MKRIRSSTIASILVAACWSPGAFATAPEPLQHMLGAAEALEAQGRPGEAAAWRERREQILPLLTQGAEERGDSAIIEFDPATFDVMAGESITFLVFLRDSPSALFGYSLDVVIEPDPAAAGGVVVDPSMTNFFDEQNLITAGGAMRDPVFSLILPMADGVFISTNTSDLSTVSPVPGVNDVLAQIVLNVSPDASGSFTVLLDDGTALADASGASVPFTSNEITINVTPLPMADPVAAPAMGGVAVGGLVGLIGFAGMQTLQRRRM